jgi:hypothetical protein
MWWTCCQSLMFLGAILMWWTCCQSFVFLELANMLFFTISILKYMTHQTCCNSSSYLNNLICLLINEIRAWIREIAISSLPMHEPVRSCYFLLFRPAAVPHLICLLINEIRAWTREIAISSLPRHEHMDEVCSCYFLLSNGSVIYRF